jgi:lipopolysaccharide/colanic/teichoic acid biosynthesis glycosyltransferase
VLVTGAYRRWGKRALDLLLVLLSSPIWLPLTLAVALLVRLRLGKPVLFTQVRPGKDGRTFTLRKFRTMAHLADDQGVPLPDHERMTRAGAALRRASLDELPELFNVLRGDMSLVGPRPLLVEYLPLYSPRQARRHEVKPGLTGLAQVSGRNALDWEDRLELDVEYVENLGLRLDLRILANTVGAVLARRGINQPGEATMKRFGES